MRSIYIRATATRSQEIEIYSREIASYILEIAADSQEIRGLRPPQRRRSCATAASSRFPIVFSTKPLHFPLCSPPPIAYPPAMNNRLQVQLNMVGSCITVAQTTPPRPPQY